MLTFLTDPPLLAIVLFGLVGAAASVAGVYLMATRWLNRSAFPYGLSIFVFYSLLYIATFEHGLINADIGPEAASRAVIIALIVGQALVTSIGVAIFALFVFGIYLALLGPQEFPVNRTKAYAGCALFCVVFSFFLNPIVAVRQNDNPGNGSIFQTAMATASPEALATAGREAKRTLESLREIGVLTRIEANETLLVHHVKAQFLDLPNSDVEKYMRAALFHHIHFEGGTVKPVVLRVADSNREIALLEANGRFRRHRAGAAQLSAIPAGG